MASMVSKFRGAVTGGKWALFFHTGGEAEELYFKGEAGYGLFTVEKPLNTRT
jgi:hypothetical protein